MIKKLIAFALALSTAAVFAAVDVNKGSQAELEAVKGIGPTMSAKILAERKKSAFKDWPDLAQRVPGIGDKRAAKLSTAGLTVGGSAFSAGTLPVKEAKARSSGRVSAKDAATASLPASAAGSSRKK